MENKMGHFIDWKFGVPVKVAAKNHRDQAAVSGEIRLIDEDSSHFVLMNKTRGACVICNKGDYHYKLTPHKYRGLSPRYPVCQALEYTAFCNSKNVMAVLDAGECTLKPYSAPIATLTIDGKTIELSAETTAELKKKLGV